MGDVCTGSMNILRNSIGRLVLLILLVASVCVVDGSLIASSKVQICKKLTSEPLTRSGDNCDKKFVVALSVRNGQVCNTHSITMSYILYKLWCWARAPYQCSRDYMYYSYRVKQTR